MTQFEYKGVKGRVACHVAMLGFSLALCAGLFASLASVASKLAFEPGGKTLGQIICAVLPDEYCTNVVLVFRGLSFLLMLLSNGLMWTLFVRSLQRSRSTVEATVANSGANFFFTAVFGMLLFEEVLPLLWWFGASLVVVGLVMIHHGANSDQERAEREKEE